MSKIRSRTLDVDRLPKKPQDVKVLTFGVSNGFLYAVWCGETLVSLQSQRGSEEDVKKAVLAFLEEHRVEVASYTTERCQYWRKNQEYID